MTLEMREREVREEGIEISVRMLKSLQIKNQNIVEQLVKEYHLTKDEAEEYVNQE